MKKIYKWGIIGPGSIARKFASDLRLLSNARLYAVASRDIERAHAFAKEFQVDKLYGSYEEIATDPDVDIIYIASHHIFHYPNAMLCLKNKKAVLCEKPVAMNVYQYNKMTETAKENKVFFMEALWTRFIPSFLKFKQLIDENAIGDVSLINCDFCIAAPYDTEGRLFNPLLGGGSLLDIGLYPVFLSLEILGKPLKIKAFATIGKTGVDESCSMLFLNRKNIPSVLFCSLITHGRTEAMVHGSKGLLRLNKFWHVPTSIDLLRDDKIIEHFTFAEPGFGYQYEAAEVMKCMDEGKIESDSFSWSHSLQLIKTLDFIRKETGIKYPGSVEKL